VRLRTGDSAGAREDLERCLELSRGTKTGKECSSMSAKLK
jgi:hypothetical protein